MTAASINIKWLVLTSTVVLLLAGCFPLPPQSISYRTVYDPQCCPTQGPARLITREESVHITGKKGIGVVELTNNQFKIQVYFQGYFRNADMEMRLIVPAGEELFIKEAFVEIFDTSTHQELDKFDASWFHEDSQLDDDTGRLIGLISSPPATIYATTYKVGSYFWVEGKPPKKEHYIDLKLPVLRTEENETIKFEDVTFKILTVRKASNHGRWKFLGE